jgi:hypothetical protein
MKSQYLFDLETIKWKSDHMRKAMMFVFLFGVIVLLSGCKPVEGVYFMDVIDPSSDEAFDYENPVRSYISIHIATSYRYALDGDDTYEICSPFETVPLHQLEASDQDLVNSIIVTSLHIEVFYDLKTGDGLPEPVKVDFYVSEDGILLFRDKQGTYYQSEASEVNHTRIIDDLTNMDQ